MFYIKNIRRRRENKNKNKINIWLIAITLTLAIFLNAQNIKDVEASEITSEKLVELTNQSRVEQGIEKLTVNQNLISAANSKARDMFEHNYFAHTSPGGLTPWHWIEESGYDYIYAGENLAINFSNAENQHKAWMESSEHRKNIISPNYKEIGVAVKIGNINGKEAVVTVQIFGAREVGAAVLSQIAKIKSGAKSEPDGLIYKTAEFNANGNPESRETIAQVKNDEEESKRMVLVMGNLDNRQNIFSGAVWIILPTVLVLSVILNIITVINSSRYHYNQFYLTKF